MFDSIDINCDMGEGLATDRDILPYITSCNIACGGHAGDQQTMTATIKGALQHQVLIGAHPSYPDKESFGRQPVDIEPAALFDSLCLQIQALQAIASQHGAELNHIKPHGALYNLAAFDEQLAELLIAVIKNVDNKLSLYGLAHSPLASIAKQQGIHFLHEAFIDRHYQNDGSLLPRSHAEALLQDVPTIVTRASMMISEQRLQSWQGDWLDMQADTYCIHGDHPAATQVAKALHRALIDAG